MEGKDDLLCQGPRVQAEEPKAQLRGGKVHWIDEDTKAQLKKLWTKDPKCKTRLERGHENRKHSEAKHTQGLVSTIHVAMKMI